MSELLAENWILLAIALIIGLVVAWYLFRSNRRTRVTGTRADVLDEGAERAQRNSALVDSPPAAAREPEQVVTPGAVGGAGAAVSPAADASQAKGDDLTRIKGVGPKLAASLRDLGVTSFAQIASWDEAEIDRIDARLGRFQGRIRRDDWTGQARLLAEGDTDSFARKYGRA